MPLLAVIKNINDAKCQHLKIESMKGLASRVARAYVPSVVANCRRQYRVAKLRVPKSSPARGGIRLQWQPKAKPAAGAATHRSRRADTALNAHTPAFMADTPTRNSVLQTQRQLSRSDSGLTCWLPRKLQKWANA